MKIQLGNSSVEIATRMAINGVPDTGKSPFVAIRRVSDDQFLDFNDNTFKAVGWTTKNQALAEEVAITELAGVYRYTWDSTVVLEQGDYSFEFSVTIDAVVSRWTEDIHFTDSDIAEKTLVNKFELDDTANTAKVYEKDGITEAKEWDITDKNGDPMDLSDMPPGLPANRTPA